MGIFDEMMKEPSFRSITEEEIKNYKPLENLKPGEVLRAKFPQKYKYPAPGENVIVYKVKDNNQVHEGGRVLTRDFTALLVDDTDKEIIEYAFDSRNFERTES